jgi:thymidylate synthase (FAD)
VVQAAQVSSKGEREIEELVKLYEEGKINIERFINALVKGKHGSPFEHNMFTFFVEAPIFVFREWHRHRIASINEMSGRYTVLPGKFYIPGEDRSVSNKGSKMKPDFSEFNEDLRDLVVDELLHNAEMDWISYEKMINRDVAPEVARMVLPVNIYSQMYWTVNARSLMNFLSLRSRQDGAAYVSYPQREIQMGAEKIEDIFAELMPATYSSFVSNGRVAP